jgi:hypothetical protein
MNQKRSVVRETQPSRPFTIATPIVAAVLMSACGVSHQLIDVDVDGDEEVTSEALLSIAFVRPTDGAEISGTAIVEVRPPEGTTRVSVFVDNVYQGKDVDGAPWLFVLDTRAFLDGVHELKVTARDQHGRRFGRSVIHVQIRNGPAADGGAVDGGEVDGGEVDGGEVDGGEVDRGNADGGNADGGSVDGGQVVELGRGIWISGVEIRTLPMSGAAWEALKAQADQSAGSPRLSDQDQMNNVYVLAKALVYARTGVERYRTEVRAQCLSAIGTEAGGRTLALGRELAAYVIAADLVGLDPATEGPTFRRWLRSVMTEVLDSKTLISTHEDRPNNWGTHAGASRVAVAAYLAKSPDASEAQFGQLELARAAAVFKGYLGDRSAYSGFSYGTLSWQADPAHPVGINPLGATKDGHSIDGAIPDDMRRGCDFTWPPCFTDYAWEAMQGVTVQAELLHRAGYDAWNWQDRAILRAARFLGRLDESFGGWSPSGDDEWNVWLLNNAYGATFPTKAAARPGKNMGWTDWTHGASRAR